MKAVRCHTLLQLGAQGQWPGLNTSDQVHMGRGMGGRLGPHLPGLGRKSSPAPSTGSHPQTCTWQIAGTPHIVLTVSSVGILVLWDADATQSPRRCQARGINGVIAADDGVGWSLPCRSPFGRIQLNSLETAEAKTFNPGPWCQDRGSQRDLQPSLSVLAVKWTQ